VRSHVTPHPGIHRADDPGSGAPTRGRDHRGSRRLGPLEQTIWYLVAGVSYIVAGVYFKWVLNWFVGPAWLVAVVVLGPWLVDNVRPRSRRRRRVDLVATES
jgi:hypothetical protein